MFRQGRSRLIKPLPWTNRFTKRTKTSLASHDTLPSWATLDPSSLGVDTEPYHVQNIVKGIWDGDTKYKIEIPNPLDRDAPSICTIPDTTIDELGPFIGSLEKISKSGVHNPLKNVERYLMYGEISKKVSIRVNNNEYCEHHRYHRIEF